MTCQTCGRRYAVENGVPQLFWPHTPLAAGEDPTEKVKAFYEQTPFPNYDEHDSLRSLIEKSRRGAYADELNRALPFNSTVLEVGCGTGQLSNFLGVSCRRVIGADMCLNSLGLAERFRREHRLARVRFAQMNLFKPCFKPAQFDVVLCNGVLHHTGDPRGGFEGLLPLLKPGGFIIVGLYNRYGRLMNGMRRRPVRAVGRPWPGTRPVSSKDPAEPGEAPRLVRGSVSASARVHAHHRRGARLVCRGEARVRSRRPVHDGQTATSKAAS